MPLPTHRPCLPLSVPLTPLPYGRVSPPIWSKKLFLSMIWGFPNYPSMHPPSLRGRSPCVSRIVCWTFFEFWLAIKTPGFYNNANLHICLICLRLVMSSLTEIQYLQIELSAQGMHTNEKIMLKMFYLYRFITWTKCIWWAVENYYLLVYKSFKVAVEWIPTIRNKAKNIYSSKNHLHYCNYW